MKSHPYMRETRARVGISNGAKDLDYILYGYEITYSTYFTLRDCPLSFARAGRSGLPA